LGLLAGEFVPFLFFGSTGSGMSAVASVEVTATAGVFEIHEEIESNPIHFKGECIR
jgi:hypothetical protein